MTPHDVRCMLDQQSVRYTAEVILDGPGKGILPALEDSELFEFEELQALQSELFNADWRAHKKAARLHAEDQEARRWLSHR